MTTSPIFTIITTAAAVGTAVVGGICFAFSTIVMRGLDRTDPVEAITAMRGINAEANASPSFLVVFLLPALVALGVGVAAAVRISQPGNGFLLAAAVFGVITAVVTMAFNVPLNNHLDAVDPSTLTAADAAREWAAYLGPWTAWNHVRTVAGVVASALFVTGLLQR